MYIAHMFNRFMCLLNLTVSYTYMHAYINTCVDSGTVKLDTDNIKIFYCNIACIRLTLSMEALLC